MVVGIEQGKTRSSGETAADEEAKKSAGELLEEVKQEAPGEDARKFRTPGFRRMRFDWRSEDRPILSQAQSSVQGRILHNFADAYQVMFEVYDLVRTPLLDAQGNPQKDQWGFTLWKQSPSGSYEEDWSKMTQRAKEGFLFQITTRIFEWEQRAADAWTEAMFAKAQFEEQYAIGFDRPRTGTVDDRKADATLESREERYFAIFLTAYSRKADAIVRSMNLLGQRIKDSMTT